MPAFSGFLKPGAGKKLLQALIEQNPFEGIEKRGIMSSVEKKLGTANIPPETTPKAVGGKLTVKEREKFKQLAYNATRESNGDVFENHIKNSGFEILDDRNIPNGEGVGFGGQKQTIREVTYRDKSGTEKYGYIRLQFDGTDGLYEDSIVSAKKVPDAHINEFFKEAEKEQGQLYKQVGKERAENKNDVIYWQNKIRGEMDANNKALMAEYNQNFDKAYADPRWMSDKGNLRQQAEESLKQYRKSIPNPSRPPEVGGQLLNALENPFNTPNLKTIVPMLGTAGILYPQASEAFGMGMTAPVGAILPSWRNPARAQVEALQEPLVDPTTLLAGPARWGGGVANIAFDSLLKLLMGQ